MSASEFVGTRCPRHQYAIITHGDLLEAARHHGDEHVEQHDDDGPVVEAEHDVADALGEARLEALAQLDALRLAQPEQRPEHGAERQLQPETHTDAQ